MTLPEWATSCTAPEWLWDLATYELHKAAGIPGLAVLVAALAVLSVASMGVLLSAERSSTTSAYVVVSSLAMPAIVARVRERPESVVFVILPIFVALCLSLGDDDERLGRRSVVWLGAITLFWAQVHPTVALAPAVVVACLVPRWARLRSRTSAIEAAGLTVLTGALASTGALGPGVFFYGTRHVHGDAVRHVLDMEPPTLDSLSMPHVAGYAALVLLFVVASAFARRLSLPRLLLVFGGLILFVTARRGISFAAILTAPAALRATDEAAAHAERRWAAIVDGTALALGLAFLWPVYGFFDETYGPIGATGVKDEVQAVVGQAILETAPAGTRALTTYDAGAGIGFAADGRVRTFFDARTPMVFGDLEYAIAREVWGDPSALGAATARFHFDAAVVDRNGPTCAMLARGGGWVTVGVDPFFTTFARKGTPLADAPLAVVRPCDPELVPADACKNPGLFAADVRALAARAETPLVSFLRADEARLCHDSYDASQVLARIPERWRAWGFRDQRDALVAAIYRDAGKMDLAVEAIEPDLEEGNTAVLSVVAPKLDAYPDPLHLRRILERGIRAADDAASPDARAALAAACSKLGDVDCARLQGERAAIRGSAAAVPTLCWLASAPRAPSVRTEARAWLDVVSPGACPSSP
jgi:hypothetical protein